MSPNTGLGRGWRCPVEWAACLAVGHGLLYDACHVTAWHIHCPRDDARVVDGLGMEERLIKRWARAVYYRLPRWLQRPSRTVYQRLVVLYRRLYSSLLRLRDDGATREPNQMASPSMMEKRHAQLTAEQWANLDVGARYVAMHLDAVAAEEV